MLNFCKWSKIGGLKALVFKVSKRRSKKTSMFNADYLYKEWQVGKLCNGNDHIIVPD